MHSPARTTPAGQSFDTLEVLTARRQDQSDALVARNVELMRDNRRLRQALADAHAQIAVLESQLHIELEGVCP